jgi:hypothetical protein
VLTLQNLPLSPLSLVPLSPPTSFALVIFQIGSHIYVWTSLDHDFPIYNSSWNDRHASPSPVFVG